MALRVLLADESATIKKVMELSLQEFAAEIKTVNLGVDVLSAAKSFQPDIVFADILLQKKNGYEVCKDLKEDPEFQNLPVIILWSGFMELDQAKLTEVGAVDSLEKPFDADTLKSLVTKYVQKTSAINPFAEHLESPDLPSTTMWGREISAIEQKNKNIDESLEDDNWNMDSFEHDMPMIEESLPDISFEQNEDDMGADEFTATQLQNNPPLETTSYSPNDSSSAQEEDDDGWVSQKLGKFQLNIPKEEDDLSSLDGLEVAEVKEKIENTNFLWNEHSLTNTSAQNLQIETPVQQVETKVQNKTQSSQANKQAYNPFNAFVDSGNISDEIELQDLSSDSFELVANAEMEVENSTPLHELKRDEATFSNKMIHENQSATIDPKMVQDLVRQEVQKVLQNVIEKQLPDLASSIIEKEIQRLINDGE